MIINFYVVLSVYLSFLKSTTPLVYWILFIREVRVHLPFCNKMPDLKEQLHTNSSYFGRVPKVEYNCVRMLTKVI
jgi:hypothetical protein